MKLGAIADCTQSLENKPDYVRPLLRRAKLYEEIDNLDEALADYKKVVELDPSVREAQIAVQVCFFSVFFGLTNTNALFVFYFDTHESN